MNAGKLRVKGNLSLNDLTSCMLVLWILNPMSHDYFSPIYVIIFAVTWCITANAENRKAMAKALGSKCFVVSWIYPIFMISYYVAGHAKLEKSSIGLPLIVLFYMYCYYRKDVRRNRLIVQVTMVYIVLMVTYTLVQLRSNPYISRLLARGNTASTAGLASPLTAGYNEIYYMVFFTITILGVAVLCQNNIFKLKNAIFAIYLLFFFIKAQYTIAIILILFGVLLAIFRKKNFWMAVIAVIGMLLLFFFIAGKDSLAEVFYAISMPIPVGILKNRVLQIGDYFSSGAPRVLGNNGIRVRLNLYGESWNTFLYNFFFGVGDDEIVFVEGMVGGHSTFIDRLAEYGILGGGLYIAVRIWILKLISSTIAKRWRYLFRVNAIIYIIMSILNTTNRNSFLMMLLVVVPLYLEYIEADTKYALNRTKYVRHSSKFCGEQTIGKEKELA